LQQTSRQAEVLQKCQSPSSPSSWKSLTLDDGIVWNRATLGIAAISSSTTYLTGQLQQIDQAVHRIAAALSAEVLDSYAEILSE
jgi:hypothetical protein